MDNNTATTFDQSIRSFLDAAASKSHTPGGGSIAALAAALGASMTSMVANLTQGAKFVDLEANMQQIASEMVANIRECDNLLEADMQSFDTYMNALKLPKDTDEQKAARSLALQSAGISATEVPLRLAELCRDALLTSQTIAKTANKNVISDLGVAAFLLEAAAQSALLTVDINLPGLKDLDRKNQFTATRDQIQLDITALRQSIVTAVRGRLA
ncbi:cyclodeaminase/cyclohydrolase family protein [Tumebacillus permanentifrigoris]|uniref:Formimidoyltetrahydrofolate cyclodeaminase n=1 Tax=Tumebacillus permanentifrigoris TaxID=378543 RepID=A0A316D7F1_9BACL|nr:cyclodeaminase/cyclohydrolase family protein [Tumebacillus permanentifrigoris]PWK11229.1 formimidoyltetrahydrofolate cyclodeaminase [Tumebacillus permanentifrigoris]